MSDTELDRIWSRLDEHDKRIDAMETPRQQQVACIHCGNPVEERRRNWSQPTCYCCLPLPVRQVGDYLPDPGFLSPDDKLRMIAGILSEMLEPSGIPSPAQRLLLRIKAVVGE